MIVMLRRVLGLPNLTRFIDAQWSSEMALNFFTWLSRLEDYVGPVSDSISCAR